MPKPVGGFPSKAAICEFIKEDCTPNLAKLPAKPLVINLLFCRNNATSASNLLIIAFLLVFDFEFELFNNLDFSSLSLNS